MCGGYPEGKKDACQVCILSIQNIKIFNKNFFLLFNKFT